MTTFMFEVKFENPDRYARFFTDGTFSNASKGGRWKVQDGTLMVNVNGHLWIEAQKETQAAFESFVADMVVS